jgi:hypothetical protein
VAPAIPVSDEQREQRTDRHDHRHRRRCARERKRPRQAADRRRPADDDHRVVLKRAVVAKLPGRVHDVS